MGSKTSFEKASTNRSKSAALLIDIQSFHGMERDDAIGYAQALGASLTQFRSQNMSIVWVGIAPGGTKLLPPQQPKTQQDCLEFGFSGHLAHHDNHDIYDEFFKNHGPQPHDIVYRKPSMSALATADDSQRKMSILEGSGIKLKQARHADDHPETVYIDDHEVDDRLKTLFPDNVSLNGFLKEHGYTDTYILGAISKYCVAETAINSAVNGYKTTILDDVVLSWKYPVTEQTHEKSILTWNNFDHRSLITEAVKTAIDDKRCSYTAMQKLQIGGINFVSLFPQITLDNSPSHFQDLKPDESK